MKIGFFSTNEGLPWGGSEYLWSRAALRLLDDGHAVAVNYKRWPQPAGALREIEARGGRVTFRRTGGWRATSRRWLRTALRRLGADDLPMRLRPHVAWLRRERPDFVLLSASYHTDDLAAASACRRAGVPYALLLHCASWHDWITEPRLASFRETYRGARRCFFVSAENRAIMEANLATGLPDAQVVCNPLSVRPETPPPWPEAGAGGDGWRLACVGRMHFRSKGQDLILRILRREKWRARPLTVTFWGRDQDSADIFDTLVERYDLTDAVTHAGFSKRPLSIWEQSHALIAPSRYEGVPMVTPEALFCARPAIATACGRNAEFVDDGETGFLAAAATPDLLDAALERAWQRRHEWKAMGREGRRRIAARYEDDPVRTFTRQLEALAAR